MTITESVRDYDVYILNTVRIALTLARKVQALMSGLWGGEHFAIGVVYHDTRVQSESRDLARGGFARGSGGFLVACGGQADWARRTGAAALS